MPRKGPVLTDIGVIDNQRIAHPDLMPYMPSPHELTVATDALSSLHTVTCESCFLARVDLALADNGSPLLLELELIEPNLFLSGDDTGLERFAEAVEAALD